MKKKIMYTIADIKRIDAAIAVAEQSGDILKATSLTLEKNEMMKNYYPVVGQVVKVVDQYENDYDTEVIEVRSNYIVTRDVDGGEERGFNKTRKGKWIQDFSFDGCDYELLINHIVSLGNI